MNLPCIFDLQPIFFNSLFISCGVHCWIYIFSSHVLTRVTGITQWNSFQIPDKTTNSPEEQALVSQGKLKNPPVFYYLYLTRFIWGFYAIKHRGYSAANISDPKASILNGLLQKVYLNCIYIIVSVSQNLLSLEGWDFSPEEGNPP